MGIVERIANGVAAAGGAMADAVKDGILGALRAVYESGLAWLMLNGDRLLITAAMMGLVFWGAGSRTAGKVIWWSVVLFTLVRAFGAQIYLYAGCLLLLRHFLRGAL